MAVNELKINLKPMLKKFEVSTSRNMMGDLTGSYLTLIKGRGLEFDGFRNYTINDDASQIDWKASLRAQQTLVKKYVEERNLNMFFLFNVSNSMLYGSTHQMKAEYAAELISSLAFAVLQVGDYAGLAMFNDKIIKTVPLMTGKQQYYIITKHLSDPKLYGGKSDFGYALKFLIQFLKKRSIVIIVSDFLGLKGDWEKYLLLASEKFDILIFIVRDPNDVTIPSSTGQVVIQDPFSQEQMVVDSAKAKEFYEQTVQEENRKLYAVLKRRSIPYVQLLTDKPFVHNVTNFLKMHAAK